MNSETKVGIILDAEDRASRQIQTVSNSLDGMKSRLEKMRPAFQTMAAVGGAAFVGIGAGLLKATQKASDAQEIFSKFDVVFGDVSDQAKKVAEDLRNNFGLAEGAAKDLLSSTGDMLTGFGLSGQAALDLAERTNKLAVDLASFTNIEGGAERASKALTKALLGERESVKELGIAILDEDVKAKIAAMEAAGEFTDETYRQKQAIATLELAMAQSKNAIGDYARTSDGLANQQRLLQQRFNELVVTLGTTFIPVLQSIIDKVSPVIEKIGEWIQKNPELARNIGLAAVALTGLAAAIGLAGLALPALITGFGLLFSPVGLVLAAVAALVAIIIIFKDKIGELFQKLDEKTGLITLMKEAWDNVTDTFNNTLLPALQELWEALKPLKPLLEFIAKVIGGALVFAIAAVVKIIEGWAMLLMELIAVGTKVQQFLVNVLVKAVDGVVNAVKSAVEWVERLIESFKRLNVVQGAKNVFSNIGNGISNLVGLASGGVVNSPTLAMVGENEPEAVIPLSRLNGGGFGGGVTININGGIFGQDSGLEVGNQIIEVLRRNMKM